MRNNWINALRETRSGGKRFLWIGTNGGAVRLDLSAGEPHWLVLDEKSRQARLPSNVVYQILEDARGRIYLATNRGMARLTPRPGDPNAYDVYTFTVRDGLAVRRVQSGVFPGRPRRPALGGDEHRRVVARSLRAGAEARPQPAATWSA